MKATKTIQMPQMQVQVPQMNQVQAVYMNQVH
jgi:hypothetical protein